MMIHHTRVPYFLQIFLFLVTRANVSLHSVTLSASLPFISKIHAKFVSRPINPLTRAYNLHVRLSPRSSLVYPLHYFFFPHSLQRGYLAAHVSLPPTLDFLTKDERYTRRNDSATRLVHVEYTYVIPDTDYNDDTQTISLILRIHWSSLQCIIVSMMQRLRIYIYVSFAFQEAMMLINFPCTANYIAVYVRGIRVKWSE